MTIAKDDERRFARLRLHHLETALEGFKTLLDREYAERQKAEGLVRRAELGTLLGIPAATMPIAQRDFDQAVARGVQRELRVRARNVWWRRLLRSLRREHTLNAGQVAFREWFAERYSR